MRTCVAFLLAGLITPHPTLAEGSVSKGFHLIARASGDDDDPLGVTGLSFVAIHTGAAISQGVLNTTALSDTRTYYLNGTEAQQRAGKTRILSDGGTPLFPWAIGIAPSLVDEGENIITVNAIDRGTPMTIVTGHDSYMVSGDGGGTFVACDRYVKYYEENTTVVGYVTASEKDGSGEDVYDIPDGCTMIALQPVCAELEALPEGSISSHEHVLEVGCFDS